MKKKLTLSSVLVIVVALLLNACGENTPTPANTTAAATALPPTAAPATTAPTTTAPAAKLAATTAPATVATTTIPATSAVQSGGGIELEVNGTKVMLKAGGNQKFQPKTPVTIRFWHSQSRDNAKALKALVDQFMVENPNIKVEVDNGNDSYGYDTINEKVLQGAALGKIPNVVTGYENHVPNYVDAKIALPLSQFISGPYGLTQAQLEDFYPNFLARGIFTQYNNEVYSWPFANSAPVMYYNKDLLDKYGQKIPETWDEFVTVSKAVYDKSNREVAGFVFKTVNPASEFVAPIFARGGQVYDYATKKFNFSDKATIDQLSMMYEGVKNGYFITSDPGVNNQDQMLFEQQKAVFYISSTSSRSYVAADLAKGTNGVTKFNFNAAVIPHAAGVKPVTTLYGGLVLGFKGKSQDEDLATWEFMKYLSSAEFQSKWATFSGYVPATKSAAETPEYKAFLEKAPENKIPLVVFQYANAYEPKIGQWQSARNIINDQFLALFQNPNGDPAATARKMEEETNKLTK